MKNVILNRTYGLGIFLLSLFAMPFPIESSARNMRNDAQYFLKEEEIIADTPAISKRMVITFQTASGEKLTGSVIYVNGKKYIGKVADINPDAIFAARQLDGDQTADYGAEAAGGVIDLVTYPDCKAEEPDLPLQSPKTPAAFRGGEPDDFARWVEESLPKGGKELTGIFVSFVITSEGKLCRPMIMNDCDSVLGERILAKIGQSSKWTPARHNKNNVDSRINTVIVVFVDTVMDVSIERPTAGAKQNGPGAYPLFEGKPMTYFREFVMNNIHYPERSMKTGGRAVVRIVIKKDGRIGNIKILQSPNDSFSKEAYRVITKSPRWTPGTDKNGNPANVQVFIPIMFHASPPTNTTTNDRATQRIEQLRGQTRP